MNHPSHQIPPGGIHYSIHYQKSKFELEEEEEDEEEHHNEYDVIKD